MNVRTRFLVGFAMAAGLLTAAVGASAFHTGGNEYHPIERNEFVQVWERTDRPVADLVEARTWIWGPGGFSTLMTEQYDDEDREVQYFDKSRMEMPTDDAEAEDSPWFITQGLLATELMTGQLQLGDAQFVDHEPSQRSAAGDPQDVTAPTYAVMGDQIERAPRTGGAVIIEHINRVGVITEDEARFAGYGVYDVDDAYTPVDGIDKNIASVFWEFMTSEGVVYQDGQFVESNLFLNAFYAVGYPKTDAFWADVLVGGNVQDVLIQCFERRCLTYTPGNPEGWEVESGNIGQHYYHWRYDEIDDDGVSDDGVADDGVADDGVADDGVADDGVADDGVADDGVADDGVADDGAADDGAADDGAADDGAADDGAADDGAADDGAADDGAADDGENGEAAVTSVSISADAEVVSSWPVQSTVLTISAEGDLLLGEEIEVCRDPAGAAGVFLVSGSPGDCVILTLDVDGEATVGYQTAFAQIQGGQSVEIEFTATHQSSTKEGSVTVVFENSGM
jgi:hypothetical protein